MYRSQPDNSLFESVVQIVREPLLILDPELRVVRANHSFYETFLAGPAETEGSRIFELCGGHWDVPGLRERLEQVIPARAPVEGFEFEHIFPVIGARILRLNARTIGGERGLPQLILLAMEDLTERRLQARQFEILNGELRRSNRDLEEFARTASHDLQEPLRKIRAFGDRLHSEAGASLSPQCSMYLERILTAAGRMQRLIGSLLTLARACGEPALFTVLDLNAIIAEVLDDMEESVARSKAAVHFSELPVVRADANLMRLLFQNLISNAIKFRKASETPVIRISSRKLPVTDMADAPAAGWLEITVEDNGIGFEDRHRERIFAVFQRLNSKDAYEGSGIGLAICRKVAALHGGSIEARSTPGLGTVFILQIPGYPMIPGRENPAQ